MNIGLVACGFVAVHKGFMRQKIVCSLCSLLLEQEFVVSPMYAEFIRPVNMVKLPSLWIK